MNRRNSPAGCQRSRVCLRTALSPPLSAPGARRRPVCSMPFHNPKTRGACWPFPSCATTWRFACNGIIFRSSRYWSRMAPSGKAGNQHRSASCQPACPVEYSIGSSVMPVSFVYSTGQASPTGSRQAFAMDGIRRLPIGDTADYQSAPLRLRRRLHRAHSRFNRCIYFPAFHC